MNSSAPVGSPGSDEGYHAAAFVGGQILLLGAQALLRRRTQAPDWGRSITVRATTGVLAIGGSAILAIGSGSLGRGLTVSPLPNDHARLRTDGLYGRIRHPIYSGVVVLSLARTLHSRDRRQAALTAMLIVLLEGKSSFEEEALRQRFAEYSAYAAGTPRFVPHLPSRLQHVSGTRTGIR